MDQMVAFVIALALFALLGFFVFRFNKGKAIVKLGNKLGSFEASNEHSVQEHGIIIEDATSEEGAIHATDHTGKGAHLTKLKAKKDITITVKESKKKQ